MNKEKIVKFFQVMMMAMVAVIVLMCLYVFFTVDDAKLRIMMVSASVGGIVGAFIEGRWMVPQKFKDADERSIILILLSCIASYAILFVFWIMCALMVFLRTVEIITVYNFLLWLLVTVVLFVATEKIAYKVLERVM